MAGMEALGRLFNVIPVASGAYFKGRGASCYTFVAWNGTATTTTTATLTEATAFASGSASLYAIKNVYWSTANNGTAGWSKLTYNLNVAPYLTGGSGGVPGALTAVTFNNTGQNIPTATCVAFTVFTSELSDPDNYICVTMTGTGGLCAAIPGDLTVQRGPANLEILGS